MQSFVGLHLTSPRASLRQTPTVSHSVLFSTAPTFVGGAQFCYTWSLAAVAVLAVCGLGKAAASPGAPAAQAAPANPAALAPLKFNRDVRPLLSDTCFHCHGFDKNSRKGELRLDLPEEVVKPAKSGAIPIVPGKPEESEVMKRLLATSSEDIMPPSESHKVLKPEQIEIFRRWIAEGAKFEEHWAYTPLQLPVVPGGKAGAEVVDAFISKQLQMEGLKMSPTADRSTLLRRLSLDLVGLPPTPQETREFVADAAPLPQAFATAVERLLASPHFGERWAVWWLDLARFSDTVGFHGDQNHRVFPYRDYVVDSFNQNKSFADFIKEQLAGDLLPNPTPEQRIATGFNRLNMMTREGGAQPGEYLAKYGAERTRTVSNALLGSTYGCAECHDHKFDPISSKDFYSLQAFFSDVKQWGVYSDYGYTPNADLKGYTNDSPFPPEILVESKYLQQRMKKLEQRMLAQAERALKTRPKLATAFAAWQEQMKAFMKENATGWVIAKPSNTVISSTKPEPAPDKKKKSPPKDKAKATPATVPEPPQFASSEDGTVLATPTAADTTLVTLTIPANMTYVSCVKLEALPHAKFKGSIFRNGSDGSGRIKLSLKHQPAGKPLGKTLSMFHAEANLAEPRYDSGHDVLGVQDGWTTAKGKAKDKHEAVFVLDSPLAVSVGDAVAVQLPDNLLANFRISISPVLRNAGLQADLAPASAHVFLASTGADAEELRRLRLLQREYLECRNGKAWSMVTEAREPAAVRVLPRGNWMDTSGEPVTPAVPHFLPNHPDAGKRRLTRLDLADWLVSKANPLTARVTVNRIWKQFFGAGISANLDDVGFQGDPPSHPELLDWLAASFRDGGWNLKGLMRIMVNSRTYQQCSDLRKEVADRDPMNRWLSSQNPRRLEAEFVRDNALAIAGLLQPDLGGPSAKPYQPDGYYAALQFPNRDYVAHVDDRQWRRGLYMHWQRTFLHPMLANFDAPMRDECLANRVYSNTPQQALTLLNDPTFAEAALAFAEKLLLAESVSASDKLDTAFQKALGRAPRENERRSLLAFLETQLEHYRSNPEDAKKLTSAGLHRVAASLPPAELAAWASTCRVVLNLHETITRY